MSFFFGFPVIFKIKLWRVLSHLFEVDLFFQRGRMLFIVSLCRGISLKFLCTSPVWGPWVTLGPFWWHHVVVEAFPLGLLADLCLCDRTPSLQRHTAHILAHTHLLLSTGNFSTRLWSVHSDSFNTLTFLLPPLFFPRRSTSSRDLLDSVSGILKPPVIFYYETLTQAPFSHISVVCLLPPSRLNPGWSLLNV